MAHKTSHLTRSAVISALINGRKKAQHLLTEEKPFEENCALIDFIRRSGREEKEFMMTSDRNDVAMSDVLPEGSDTAQKLRNLACVETVQDLLLCDLQLVTAALTDEFPFLREAIVAMHSNTIGVKSDASEGVRRSKPDQ